MATPSIPTRLLVLVYPATLLFGSCLLPDSAHAQVTRGGRVVDSSGAPVAYANIQLRLASDSSLAQATISDTGGDFRLDEVESGAYRIHVSRIGYQSTSSPVVTFMEGVSRQLPAVVLEPEVIAVEGVLVEAKKALYQQQSDRLIINIESSPTLAGASALQVLERSPGVVVDRMSGSISLIGKDGVRVMINGKLSYIPADGLVQYLSGMSAGNVERIELITSPPASLDAEGNAGYINLVLKQTAEESSSGTLGFTAGYGSGEIGSANTSFGYQRGRLRLDGSYSFSWNAQRQTLTNFRSSMGPDGRTEMPASSRRDPVQRNNIGQIGIEYGVDERTTIGMIAAAYDNRWSMTALNRLSIEQDGAPITRIDSDNEEVNQWRHAMGNLNLQRELGSSGSLRLDVDYLRYGNDNPTVYLNSSTDVASGVVTNEEMDSGKTTPLSIVVLKADYNRIQEGWEVGAGMKGAFSRFTNETSLGGTFDEDWTSSAGFGSTSRLREDVLAVYATAGLTPRPSTTLKMGLRYEITDSNLSSDAEADIVDRRFGSFFPSVSLSQKLGEAQQISASYTRRITRPSFSDMAPFLYFFDPHTFFSGNPALQPAITSTLKLDGSYRSVLASLQYAWEDSTIAHFQNRFVPEHNIHVIFPTNFEGTRTATAVIAAPLEVAGWWSTQNNAMLNWQRLDGARNDVPVILTSTSYRVNSSQNFTLPGEHGAELSGFYQSASLFGAIEFGATWQVNAAIQKTLGDAKLTLAVTDVFDSFGWDWTTGSREDPLFIATSLDMWPRSVSIAYSRSFGTGRAETRPVGASEEERGRVQ